MTVPNELFWDFLFIAYKIQEAHPDWDMEKCIEYAVKGTYNGTDYNGANLKQTDGNKSMGAT